jgi:AcrR family transcriptional regulator
LPAPSEPGLRERKKARTHAAIQAQALALFRERGYDATTVEQIAAAAEVSPSTFFRYFPTKADVVLWDEFDPLIAAAFAAQPRELTPLEALRAALSEVFSALTPEQLAAQGERTTLAIGVPELRAAMLDQLLGAIALVAQLVAERSGRASDDPAVRTFGGAVVGAMMAVTLAVLDDPEADLPPLIDGALAQLAGGLTL